MVFILLKSIVTVFVILVVLATGVCDLRPRTAAMAQLVGNESLDDTRKIQCAAFWIDDTFEDQDELVGKN